MKVDDGLPMHNIICDVFKLFFILGSTDHQLSPILHLPSDASVKDAVASVLPDPSVLPDSTGYLSLNSGNVPVEHTSDGAHLEKYVSNDGEPSHVGSSALLHHSDHLENNYTSFPV